MIIPTGANSALEVLDSDDGGRNERRILRSPKLLRAKFVVSPALAVSDQLKDLDFKRLRGCYGAKSRPTVDYVLFTFIWSPFNRQAFSYLGQYI